MSKLIFKYADQAVVYPKLIEAVNKLCADKKLDANCVSGYRSRENQIATNKSVLQSNPGSRQLASGAVYSKDNKCLAAAYGESNHCYGLALDIDSLWFKNLKNPELSRYGLVKPMDYEPWHVELIATRKLIARQKPVFYFQYSHGLVADGIAGSKTQAKIEELQDIIKKIGG